MTLMLTHMQEEGREREWGGRGEGDLEGYFNYTAGLNIKFDFHADL